MKILTVEQLKQLRYEIVLGSLYMDDYNNSFMSKEEAWELFNGYLIYLEGVMIEKVDNFNDDMFHDYLEVFDNIETLSDYYFSNF